MASVDLSLDDIIRKTRIPQARRGRGGIRTFGVTRPQFKQIVTPFNRNVTTSIRGGFGNSRGKPPVGDARNQIIFKNRTKIMDARDKLAEIAKQKDARLKLETLRMTRGVSINNTFGNVPLPKNIKGGLRTRPKLNRGFTDLTRQVRSSPLFPHHHVQDNTRTGMYIPNYEVIDVSMDEEYVPEPLKIVRSINNDLSHFLPPPDFPQLTRNRSHKKPLRDKTVLSNRQAGFNLTIVAKNNELRKNSSGILKRSYRDDEEKVYNRGHSPVAPVSILKKRPSMALRKRLESPPPPASPPPHRPSRRTSPPRQKSPPKPAGYRIVVSNLQNTVTASDIHELFGDIGDLLESRLVRPGTAEVIYNTLKDAQKAVDVYHNRQLDGQPMNCFLVNPRNPPTGSRQNSSSKSSSSRAPSSSNLPASSNSSVVPDISTFHKVLFGKE